MSRSVVIRNEEPRDAATIAALTRAAFADHPHSNDTEHLIVAALRKAGALAISLVADDAGRLVGYIAFSPVVIADGTKYWYGLGPVSVVPDRQRQGIGSALVEAGLARLRELDAAGCVVLGEPAYYRRFGFANDSQLTYAGVPAEYFLALSFGSTRAAGEVRYHDAFAAIT